MFEKSCGSEGPPLNSLKYLSFLKLCTQSKYDMEILISEVEPKFWALCIRKKNV